MPPFAPFPDLRPGVFVERPNRFLTRVLLDGPPGRPMGDPVEAHLPDPGRLRELLVPGRRVLVRPVPLPPSGKPLRRTRFTLVLVETPDRKGLVSLDTTLPNRLVGEALAEGVMGEFDGWRLDRAEVRHGASRFDFRLVRQEPEPVSGPSSGTESPSGASSAAEVPPVTSREAETSTFLYLEVKSVTLVEEGRALFPDAVTARGARHLGELAELARQGTATAVLFVAQRDDVREIEAARSIDPSFAEALAEARRAGVQVYGRRCRVSAAGVELLDPVPVV